MSWILVTNDDGIDSPALFPFARAVSRLGEVRVVVPDSERSWISKAITRYGDIDAKPADRDGIPALAVSGYPADAVQIGAIHWDSPPRLVVSGINLGYNHGTGYVMASGTVGAAIEGWELGIPSFAFSAGSVGVWEEWHTFVSSPGSKPEWERLSALSVEILEQILSVDFPGDIVNINMPFDADGATPRHVTGVARVAYGPVHRQVADGLYRHTYREEFSQHEPLEGTDVGVNKSGEIAITPMMMPGSVEVPDEITQRPWSSKPLIDEAFAAESRLQFVIEDRRPSSPLR